MAAQGQKMSANERLRHDRLTFYKEDIEMNILNDLASMYSSGKKVITTVKHVIFKIAGLMNVVF